MFLGLIGSMAGGMISHGQGRDVRRDEGIGGEHRGVVGRDVVAQECPHSLVRRGRVDVAAPDPASVAGVVVGAQRKRLGVVGDDDVVAVAELGSALRGLGQVLLALLGGERVVGPLQAVVDRLRDVEEPLIATDQPPLGNEAEVAQERDLGAQDLGHAAAVGSGAQVQHTQPAQGCGQAPQLRDRGLAG